MGKTSLRCARTREYHPVRDALLDTAERLLGEQGLEGVSLRQIGVESGHANNSVIQYHFGGKAELIKEIVARRVRQFEPVRLRLLAQAELQPGGPDAVSLLRVIHQPVAEVIDDNGRHTYARFSMQFLISFRHTEGLESAIWNPASAPAKATALLVNLGPRIPEDIFQRRMCIISGMFYFAVIERENALSSGRRVETEGKFFSSLYAMMASALFETGHPLSSDSRRIRTNSKKSPVHRAIKTGHRA